MAHHFMYFHTDHALSTPNITLCSLKDTAVILKTPFIFQVIFQIIIMSISGQIALRWMPQYLNGVFQYCLGYDGLIQSGNTTLPT